MDYICSDFCLKDGCQKKHPMISCKFGKECYKQSTSCTYLHECWNGYTCIIPGCRRSHIPLSSIPGRHISRSKRFMRKRDYPCSYDTSFSEFSDAGVPPKRIMSSEL